MKKRYFLSILIIIFCIFLSGPVMSEDTVPGKVNNEQINSRLTEEQKEEIKTTVEEMKKSGASKEEIKSALQDLLKTWGITPKSQGNQSQQRNFRDNLTEEQKELLKTKIEEMKNAGASKEEIKSALQSLLKTWGITPENRGNQSRQRDWMNQLTDEQKKELKFTVEGMKNDGASWEEIRSVVKNMLKDWGITPQNRDNQSQKRDLMSRLTEEQRQELKSTVAEMKKAGISQEEIRSVVKKKLKEWGITMEGPEQRDNKKTDNF